MALPAPRTWADGEEPENIPTADDLNEDWRDSFDFLLGTTRPMISLAHSTVQAITNTATAIAMQVEVLKRGGMTHAANSSDFVVPYDGMYQGYWMAGYATYSTVSTRSISMIMVNGVETARVDNSPSITSDWQLHGSMTLNLSAGDTVQMRQRNTNGTVNTNITSTSRSRIALWWSAERTF